MGNIVLFNTNGSYGTPKRFLHELGEAFKALGKTPVLLDLESSQSPACLKKLFNEPREFVFSFNGYSLFFKLDDKTLHEALGVPLVAMCIDNPSRFRSRFSQKVQDLIVTCVDSVLVESMGKKLPPSGAVELLFHGACDLVEEPYVEQERNIDVLFAGSYWDPDLFLALWKEFSPRQQLLLSDITSYVLSHSGVSIEQAWQKVMLAQPNLSDFYPYIVDLRLLQLAEYYVGSIRRRDCLNMLADAGISVMLYGRGWEAHPAAKRHHLCGEVTFPDLMRLMRRTKVVLNIQPPFTVGSHERPLTAMLQKAAVISDGNAFFEQQFESGKHLLFYDWNHLPNLCDQIVHLLQNSDERASLGESAHEEVRSKHLWQHRAEQILKIVDAYQKSSHE